MALTENTHALEFLLSEANGQRSRDNGTTSAAVTAGAVLELDAGDWKPIANAAPTSKTLGIACTDAASGAMVAVLVRDAEVDANAIDWGALAAGTNRDDAVDILAGVGILIR